MPPNSRSNLWEKPDTESRNLHTIGEFFPLLIQLFSILNICSALIPLLPQQPPRLQVRVQYSEQLFYTWAITISYGGGHGSHGIQSRNSGRARAEYFGGSRATPRGTYQRGDQPQAWNPQKFRELHFADPEKRSYLRREAETGRYRLG